MWKEREVKQERSIPVQGRIDIKSLAELDAYWESVGVNIKTMSQLLSWSVDLCHEIVRNNGHLPISYKTVAESHNHLERRGLYQNRLKSRSMVKISAAMRMENMRFEGKNPAVNDPVEYNMLHNKRSVNAYEGNQVKSHYGADIDEAVRVYHELEEEERREKEEEQRINIERQKANAMKSGRVVHLDGESETVKENMEKARKNQEFIEQADMMPPPSNIVDE